MQTNQKLSTTGGALRPAAEAGVRRPAVAAGVRHPVADRGVPRRAAAGVLLPVAARGVPRPAAAHRAAAGTTTVLTTVAGVPRPAAEVRLPAARVLPAASSTTTMLRCKCSKALRTCRPLLRAAILRIPVRVRVVVPSHLRVQELTFPPTRCRALCIAAWAAIKWRC